jgi:hypothetical protein
MTPEEIALVIGAVVFASGLLGLFLQRVLPEPFTTGGVRDMIGAVVGLLTLLSALVLGLLIWTAYGVYSGQDAAIRTLAAKTLQLDLALSDYGEEARAERAKLRDSVRKTIDEVWSADRSDTNFAADNLMAALRNLRDRDVGLTSLHPTTEAQKHALANANATVEAIGQARLQMSLALTNPISYHVIVIVAAWATVLFWGFGLMSRGHGMSVLMLLIGASAVATAFYLILDLSSPYAGFFRPSPAPLDQVLAVMGGQ